MSDEWHFLVTLNERLRPLKDPVEIQEIAVRLICEHLQADRVNYAQIEGNEFVVKQSYARGVPPFAGRGRGERFGKAIVDTFRRGETVVVNDVRTDRRFMDAERVQLLESDIAAFVGVPLTKEGRWDSVLGVHSSTPRHWTRDQIALVEVTADRTWSAGAREHAEEALNRTNDRQSFLRHLNETIRQVADPAEIELRRNEERLKFLLRLNDALRPLSDPGDVQETAARLLGQHLSATRVGYAEMDGGRYTIRREYTNGVPPLAGQPPGILVGDELGAALRRGETIVVNDVQTDPRLSNVERASLHERQIAALIGATLFKDGRMVAAFGANHVAPRVWTQSEVSLVHDVAERTWDAVERTRAEAALREQKQRLRIALEASAGGSWIWDAATNQVDWDERFRPLYGFAPDQPATPDAWVTRVHEDDRPRLLALREAMWTSKTMDSWESTFRIVRPDGTVAWIQSRGRVDRDTDGNVTRLTGLDLDFSQHHRTEEALQARREEEHDRALRTLLETATQGIVSVDAQGIIVSANHAFDAMFSWAPGDLIGRPIEGLMPSALQDGDERRGDVPHVGVRSDGSRFPIEVSVNHVPTPGGTRTFAFVTDITDRQRAASALQERTAELEYRTTQLRRMASDLTLAEQHTREQIAKTLHDGLQQLLVIVGLNLEQQLRHDREGGAAPSELLAEAKHNLEEAVAAARSLNFELFPPVLQQAGLPAALTWLANWTQEKYKLEVRLNVDPHADSGRKDVRTLLFESVRELIFNAVKHAHADRVTVELALDSDDQLCITVSDHGIGFEPAGVDHRSSGGQPGWGLFSIRERLTLLGGHFEIDSAPGKGTRVRLVAPRGNAQSSESGPTRSTFVPVASAAAGNGHASPDALRILIVDDHAAVRSALRDMLNERPQLSVVGDASNGFEAIEHAHTLRPDVILMDIAMPHMDGIQATARIRAELPAIKILGLSMHPRSAAAQAIEQAGAESFFVKGVDTERLIDHLLVVHASRGAGHPAQP
jgi:PAS domain S-box-containing protein